MAVRNVAAADQAAPQAMARNPQPRCRHPRHQARTSNLTKDDLDITGALSGKPVAPSTSLPAPLPLPAPQKSNCANPDALGVGRVSRSTRRAGRDSASSISSSSISSSQRSRADLRHGPWPGNTPAVLKALDDECTKALFFPIGKHATYHPEILRQVLAAGHTVGAPPGRTPT